MTRLTSVILILHDILGTEWCFIEFEAGPLSVLLRTFPVHMEGEM